MTQVAVVDVKPNVDFYESAFNLIEFKEVEKEKISLQRIYDLVDCDSRMVERIILGRLPNGNFLDLIIDEEGTFGQWDRGIKICNKEGDEYTVLGNCVFVQSTPEGDWIGWNNQIEMADAIRPYSHKIKYFQLEKK